MDVVVWLRSLGLGKYEAAFRENEIDETVLPSLTHETLKELGVTAVGHRLKLLDAIAALRNDASGKAFSVDAATPSSAPSAHLEDRAERRQVTVMFSDLVGSTAGLIEKAAHLWGTAGQRSLERSALVEAAEQLARLSINLRRCRLHPSCVVSK